MRRVRGAGSRTGLLPVVAGVAGVLGLLWVVLVAAPPWFVQDRSLDGLKAQNEVRTTLLQGLGGVVLLVGAYFTYRQLRTTREGQITERYTRAIDQLGHAQLDVRLGGIYALERIARDSPADRATIGEVLTAFVRSHAPWPPRLPGQYVATAPIDQVPELQVRAPDVQASLTVLGRGGFAPLEGDSDQLDLHAGDLRHAYLADAHLEQAKLAGAHLERANLAGAHLEFAVLIAVHLEGANLRGAHLRQTSLDGAWLERADLTGAGLEFADLIGARLEGANLVDAHLGGATLGPRRREWTDLPPDVNLGGLGLKILFTSRARTEFGSARLEGAVLSGAHLEGANLRGAHLEGANLGAGRWEWTDLGGMNLEGWNRFAANLEGADLGGAHLERANLRGVRLKGAILDGSSFRGRLPTRIRAGRMGSIGAQPASPLRATTPQRVHHRAQPVRPLRHSPGSATRSCWLCATVCLRSTFSGRVAWCPPIQ